MMFSMKAGYRLGTNYILFALIILYSYQNSVISFMSVRPPGPVRASVNPLFFAIFITFAGHRYLNVTRDQENINIINKTAGAGTGNGNGIHGTRTEHGAARIYTSLPEFIRRAYGHFKIGAPGNTDP
nr:PREDICTED: uncharacterized protein LOC109039732 [Bemisia tabaci]